MTIKTAKGIYNIGTARGYSLNNLIEIIAEISNKPVPPIRWKERRIHDIQRIILDNTLARKELGWEPVTSLIDGIRFTWDWVSSLTSPKGTG
jgi:UDP-glucose 4-epimerase